MRASPIGRSSYGDKKYEGGLILEELYNKIPIMHVSPKEAVRDVVGGVTAFRVIGSIPLINYIPKLNYLKLSLIFFGKDIQT
jgi:hypothetical protein